MQIELIPNQFETHIQTTNNYTQVVPKWNILLKIHTKVLFYQTWHYHLLVSKYIILFVKRNLKIYKVSFPE
jgi:hypothetical protein